MSVASPPSSSAAVPPISPRVSLAPGRRQWPWISADRSSPSAQRNQDRSGLRFPLIEADAERVPLRTGAFDLVVSEYGAGPWCDPRQWLPEAARLLRPGGRLVFLTNSVLAGLCVPAEEGLAGDRLLRPQRDLFRIEWSGGGVEWHPGHGDWIRELRAAGFVIDALHELYPPAEARTHAYYDIVTAEWAEQWPAEDLWVAHRAERGELPTTGSPGGDRS